MTRFPLRFPVFARALVAAALLASIAPAWSLKPSYEADRLVMAAGEAMQARDYARAEDYLNQARRLGIALPADYDFRRGQLLQRRGDLTEARSHLEDYVDAAGSSGEHYREALALITEIEGQSSASAGRPAAASADGTAEIRWANRGEEYLDKIRETYRTPDTVQALTRHINSLLKFYAYGDERIIAASRMGTPTRHRIHTSDRGELVSLNKTGTGDEEPFTEDRFVVYGIDPYLDYRCSSATGSCWLQHPVTGARWIQIVGNEQGADELVRAFAELMKEMQKQG